ncbi:MAG TPA: 16S rRNA (uracil(1498)-N(3))-methyltransferase [Jatrophihabitantaceae bacterium]|jgi:16S rRNA (uracil1498-N3)-methyltransferase
MTAALFLVDALPPGDVIVLDGAEGRHAARVKRISAGEAVLISDGRGSVAHCVVDTVASDQLTLRVLERRTVPEPDPRVVVVQALPKGERAELAVELLTELGVDEIVPWAASRSIAHWSGERGAKALAKWRRVAAEAAKQSRRDRVPVVSELASTVDVAGRLDKADAAFVLHEAAAESLTAAALPDRGEVVLVVGPEGGVSDDELDAFAAARAVRLGDPVLRTSTAGAAAVAALSVRLKRW